MKYVNVVIDNDSPHTDRFFTYGTELPELRPGDRVFVPFTRGNKLRPAYVFQVLDRAPEELKDASKLKMVESRDPEVSLPADGPALAAWMKERYFCRYIDGIRCFTPSGASSKRGKQRVPYQDLEPEEGPAPELTEEQRQAMERISSAIAAGERKTFLIHGVTSSGKTEIYLRAAAECLARGKSVVMLVPEISLAPQTVRRFLGRFGAEQVAVLHSKLSAGERYDEWMRIRQGRARIVVGARSAVFAPFSDLGLIILDEEHETTYKSDMSPKYDTAEVAIERAGAQGAVVLLGSATPSLGAAFRAETGEYEKLVLKQRYNKTPLPSVEVADMRQELRDGNRSMFSRSLYQDMKDCLDRGRQIILFLNRRGYSTFISCRSCGYVMRCPDCGIAETYHKAEAAAVCHYCGRREPVPELCPDCGSKYIRHFGTGTEKVEEAVQEAFPEASVQRLDMDTARKKGSGEAILTRFRKGKTQILIGTQLVAKGLDFANVGLVGVVSADVSLNIPDFRSPERTFQLVTQAAGRAGRGDLAGKVVIQTYSPDHYAVQAAAAQDYEMFYREERRIRELLGYPPYGDLFQLVVSAPEEAEAAEAGEKIKEAFLRWVGRDDEKLVLGPHPAPVNKANEWYRCQLLIKCPPEKRARYQRAVNRLREKVTAEKDGLWRFSADVNPYSFL
ncbi:MAG: primosomal protein N' [Bacillota bacterium]|nr:primosomal protein N' [Bacillota bacterium]